VVGEDVLINIELAVWIYGIADQVTGMVAYSVSFKEIMK
jgi:hypothetical protein